jgi:hypothetical protein
MAAGFCEANKMSHWQFFRYLVQIERFYRHVIEDFEWPRRHRGRIPEPTVVEPTPAPTAEGSPTLPQKPPMPDPTSKQQLVDSPGVSAPAQPVVPSRRPRRISHRRRPFCFRPRVKLSERGTQTPQSQRWQSLRRMSHRHSEVFTSGASTLPPCE